jgi:hypothetical protein
MELSFRVLRDRPAFHAMVWLNPLWIVEGPGQLHIDMLALAATVAGVVFLRQGRLLTGWAAYCTAVLCKYSFGVTGFWFWLYGASTTRQRVLRPWILGAMLMAFGAVAFAPFAEGPATALEPLHTIGRLNPGGSITEVAGVVVNVLRGGTIPGPAMAVPRAVELDRQTNSTTWLVISLVLRIVTLGIGWRVLRRMLSKPHDDAKIALGTGVLLVAVITLASHRFQSWYLMAALPFFGLRCPSVWQRWWTAVVAVSVAMEFLSVLPRNALIYPAWSGLTTSTLVFIFLMSFRARYLDVPFEPRATSPLPFDDVAREAAKEMEAR